MRDASVARSTDGSSAPWAAAWVDLLDDLEDARVLLIDSAPGRAAAAIVSRGSRLAIVEDDARRVDLRRACLPDPDAARFGSEEDLLRERWDVVVVDGDPGAARAMATRSQALTADGRLVLIADNRLSPLRAADRMKGLRAGTATAVGLPDVRRWLRAAHLRPRQVFGLLRSSAAPVTAFDLDAPVASRAVLAAAATHIAGARRAGLAVLSCVAGRSAAGLLVPAWLVVADRGGERSTVDTTRLTGRIGYERTAVIKLLRGEPPVSVEKVYPDEATAAAETLALTELAAVGIAEAPKVEGRKARDRAVLSWVDGSTLDLKALPEAELERWTERAATLLGEVQRRTRRADGQVLVHGDYWLGNVLVSGDHIVAIIDWVGAHWGRPEVDRAFLASSLIGFRATNPKLMGRLAAAVERGAGPVR